MDDLTKGNTLSTLFHLKSCTRRRESSYARDGSNRDWVDIEPAETREIAALEGAGIVRHFWCTIASYESHYPRRVVLQAWWDDEETPSIEAPIGDFFGIGHGITKNFVSEPLAMSPDDGRAFNCYFPMPFADGARFRVRNDGQEPIMFYYYIDYESYEGDLFDADVGYFHAQWRREPDTNGSAPKKTGVFEEKAGDGYPEWYPSVWAEGNTDGSGNYVILEATGRGKYVGCNLNIDCIERQANDWYGEGDDMIFVDGEAWPPSIHGTGTEDYFNTAFCPTDEYCSPYHGITLYSGNEAHWKWGGKNSMYRFHIPDPIYFQESIRVTIEHGHNNLLSNDYSSTAYWYQGEPHAPFPPLPQADQRLPRSNRA